MQELKRFISAFVFVVSALISYFCNIYSLHAEDSLSFDRISRQDVVGRALNLAAAETSLAQANVRTRNKKIDGLGLTAIFVEESKRNGPETLYYTRYDVEKLDPNGIAAKAGIRSSDSILYFNGQTFLGDPLERYIDGLAIGQYFVLTIRPYGTQNDVRIELRKSTSVPGGQMITMMRRPGDRLEQDNAKFNPKDPSNKKVKPEEFAQFIDNMLYFLTLPYKKRIEIYFSGNGVVGMKYNIGNSQKRYCGKWWIGDNTVCWNVLGSSQRPICLEVYFTKDNKLVLYDSDPKDPESYELVKSEPTDSLGYGRNSRRAFDEYMQITARENRKLNEYFQTHRQCEAEWARAQAEYDRDPRNRRRLSPSFAYDNCMTGGGFPMGIFSAMSLRTGMAIYERILTGQSTMSQCTF